MNRPTKLSAQQSYPLFTADATRAIEQIASACLPNHTLMQRAGLAAAQWTLALAPHAQHIWVACGPGNKGGDGYVDTPEKMQKIKDAVKSVVG